MPLTFTAMSYYQVIDPEAVRRDLLADAREHALAEYVAEETRIREARGEGVCDPLPTLRRITADFEI